MLYDSHNTIVSTAVTDVSNSLSNQNNYHDMASVDEKLCSPLWLYWWQF